MSEGLQHVGPDSGEWLSVREVAQQLRVSEMTIYRWVRAGRLHAARIRGTRMLRIPRHAVEALLGDSRT